MQKGAVIIFLLIAFPQYILSQQYEISGKLIDAATAKPVPAATVKLKSALIEVKSGTDGHFKLIGDLPPGNQIISIVKEGFVSKNLPVILENEKEVRFELIPMEMDLSVEESQIALIALSEQELDADGTEADYAVSGLLGASKDVFFRAAAYDFSATFFRPRGLSSEDGQVLINGILMNKIYSGRPLWANWGGLNDIQRNRVFSAGLEANDYTFGNLAGTTNMIMRASQYRHGGRISYASSNRTYQGRFTASYSTGLNQNGWAFTLALARRYGNQGYIDGSLYDANSLSLSVEKRFNQKHSLNFLAFYTPNRRGKSSANTEEVIQLGGTTYNAYWGSQNGQMRNSRVRETQEPVFMINHYWDLSKRMRLNTNIAYQTGSVGNSRLGYDNAPNPDPTYYQKLPGYFKRAPEATNLNKAYQARASFENDPQLDWTNLYETNLDYGGPARYYLFEDRVDDDLFSFSSILNVNLNEHINLDASIRFKSLDSHNFANLKDLLGASSYLDIDTFNTGDAAQSDLDNPNRLVGEEDIISYNYKMHVFTSEAFGQLQYEVNRANLFLAARMGHTSYQREGLFRNGNFPENSKGKSDPLNFTPYALKLGGTYKFDGRHVLNFNSGYITNAPSLRNSFSNARQNNSSVINLTMEKNATVDVSYIYRSPVINARFTSYFIDRRDGQEISFYYADGISGQGRDITTAFVQEVLTGVNKRHLGFELGGEVQLNTTLKLKVAAAAGQFTYSNNPDLYLTSDDFEREIDFGKSYLKNYHLAGGPQRAYQLGFEYRDPDYWWFGATTNYFSHAFVDISPLTRTENFYQDIDGQLVNNYDPDHARDLLKQERFEGYPLVNAVGGKSWRIDDYYLGLFAVINNVFNKQYRTGGFEQGRNANYAALSEDVARDTRLFGPRYWQGYGTTYYVNLYLRF